MFHHKSDFINMSRYHKLGLTFINLMSDNIPELIIIYAIDIF